MDNKDLERITSSIKETLGEEGYAKVSDSIGELITGNTLNLDELKNKEEQISKLKETNQQLIVANGNLLKQVPMGKDEPTKDEDAKPQKINLRDAFDKNGMFKH
ncbi:MAG: hypothetical protein J6S67_21565 [Methanobrevibacter sp.]|nr:hypothetical protein [Methanobrevibacter sp.]